MSFVDIFKTLMYLEKCDQSTKLRGYADMYCNEKYYLMAEYGKYDPVSIEDLSYRKIKERWNSLCKVYNIPYTIILYNSNYMAELMSDKNTQIISELKLLEYGIYVVTIMHSNKVYTIATYAGKVTIVNSQEAPLTPSLIQRDMKTIALHYEDDKLVIRSSRFRGNSGMLVHYDTTSVSDLATLLGGNICIVEEAKLDMDVRGVLSAQSHVPHSYFEHACIHAILEDNGDIGNRYSKLVTALKCLDKDAPGKLNAILNSMEE